MKGKVSGPRVQDHGDTELSSQTFWVLTQLEKGLACTVKQEVVDDGRVKMGKGTKFCRKGQHHVEVVCG